MEGSTPDSAERAYNPHMRYFYGQFDGTEFPTPEKLFGFDQFMQFIMKYGAQALAAIAKMLRDAEDPRQAELLQQLIRDGLLEQDAKGGLQLTPRAVGRMQNKALLEVFRGLRDGQRDGHEKLAHGPGGERVEGTKPYEYGDNVSELDLHATIHNALHRRGLPERRGRGGPLIRFDERDFELHLHEGTANCATAVLLDMSGSMMRNGRFLAAKKVALGMQALVRGRFPQDSLDFIGFYSGACRIPEALLPLAMPKPISTYDHEVRLRVPLGAIDQAPQHFTNLHLGLQMARRILRRRPSANRQIFIITDGQPTAHVEGDNVYLLYPPDERSTVATLQEALLAVRDGCRIATFALIEDYWGMEWVGFVEQMTRLTRGTAFYTNSESLASCIMESYLTGKKTRTCVG
jgi:Ca-activated chloride channel homolog